MKADDLEVIRRVTLASSPAVGCGPMDLTGIPDGQCALRWMAAKSPTPEAPIWATWAAPDHRGEGISMAITGNGPHGEANAVFFAGARQVILALCDEVEILQRENVGLRSHISALGTRYAGIAS